MSRVLFSKGLGKLPRLEIESAWSRAEVYLHGAHVTHFQKLDEPPLIFLSRESLFGETAAIRGGIPIIFPWFGPRTGEASHGFARTQAWTLREISQTPDGAVELCLTLPETAASARFPKCSVEYRIGISQTLTVELAISNHSAQDFEFENCLHTYFQVGDIGQVEVTGLKGIHYLDKTEGFTRKTEQNERIKITQETDRVYFDTIGAVEINDSVLARRIRVEKSGSSSTVLWNPWEAKARALPDFADDEYRKMICVESGNVGENRIKLAPGESSKLKATFSARESG